MGQQKKGWWGRNWVWFLPVGCMGIFILGVGLLVGLAAIGFHFLRSSDPYQMAVAAAKADPRVIAALGSPVEDGWFFSGNINESNSWSSGSGSSDSGIAEFTISIHGPKGKGTLHAVGSKSGGKWIFSLLVVTVNGTGKSIDLKENPKRSELRENYQRAAVAGGAAFSPQPAG
jgi:hypothetical protein